MKSAIFLANGFEECEALIVVDLLRRAKLPIDIVSIEDNTHVISSHNVEIICDENINDINFNEYEALILPGGMPGTLNLEKNQKLIKALIKHNNNHKLIAAICAAPSVLGHIGLLDGLNFTCFPSFEEGINGIYQHAYVVQDANIITSCGLAGAFDFAHKIIENLKDIETAQAVFKQIQKIN